MDPTDYNGNGDVKEGIKAEIDTFAERLYAAIQAYAKDKGTPILYDVAANPYFFVDANEDGKADLDDKGAAIRYNAWTPTLLKAAFNYQYLPEGSWSIYAQPQVRAPVPVRLDQSAWRRRQWFDSTAGRVIPITQIKERDFRPALLF